MNFWPEFIKLKTAIGGNREPQHYEESFGLPLEEQLHITVPNKHNKRLISQLEFAIRLNEENQGAFDGCIRGAMDHLNADMAADGCRLSARLGNTAFGRAPCVSSAVPGNRCVRQFHV